MIPSVYLRMALFAAGIALGWMINGWRLNGTLNGWWADLADSKVESIELAREIESASAAVSQQSAETFEAARQQLLDEEAVIVKEVIKYVEVPTAGACELSNRWVWIDTNSAAGMPEDAAAAARVDDSPSRFTDVDAIGVIAKRNFICRAEIEKLRALQEYVRGQQKLLGADGEKGRSR